jgi:hypothetical protein
LTCSCAPHGVASGGRVPTIVMQGVGRDPSSLHGSFV